MTFTWYARIGQAYQLLYEGKRQEDVAAIVGVTSRTLRNWAARPEWKERAEEQRRIHDEIWRQAHRKDIEARMSKLFR